MSKYWPRPQVSGCRKGKEKVWACETPGRTHWRNTVTAAAAQLDRRAIATPARRGPSPWSPGSLCGDSAEPIGQLPPEVPEVSANAAWLLGYQSRARG